MVARQQAKAAFYPALENSPLAPVRIEGPAARQPQIVGVSPLLSGPPRHHPRLVQVIEEEMGAQVVAKGLGPGRIDVLEDREPAVDGLVVDLEVLAEVGDRQGGPDSLRQQVDQVLDEAHLADPLEVPEILPDDAGQAVALPDAVLGHVSTEQGLGEAAELEELLEVLRLGRGIELTQGERVQAEVTIAVGEGVDSLAVVVEDLLGPALDADIHPSATGCLHERQDRREVRRPEVAVDRRERRREPPVVAAGESPEVLVGVDHQGRGVAADSRPAAMRSRHSAAGTGCANAYPDACATAGTTRAGLRHSGSPPSRLASADARRPERLSLLDGVSSQPADASSLPASTAARLR